MMKKIETKLKIYMYLNLQKNNLISNSKINKKYFFFIIQYSNDKTMQICFQEFLEME